MQLMTVAAYEGSLCSGGPEEGGWWYWGGELVAGTERQVWTEWGVRRAIRKLHKAGFNPGGDRSSVRPREDDYEVVVNEGWGPIPRWVPESRPHYE